MKCEISSKRWYGISILSTLIALIFCGAITAIIDPFFHYHMPLKQLQYPIDNSRYQNDGIVKHFEYDTLITGTSMTQNFKASEMDRLFDVHSIKVPFSGARYKEINDNINQAIQYNSKLKMVLRGLDYNAILIDKDEQNYDSYPTYLYDDIIWNDVYYVLNKEVVFNNIMRVFSWTHSGKRTTDFDTYANWMQGRTFGKKAVDKSYSRIPERSEKFQTFTIEDKKILEGNLSQNVTSVIEENPDITFYLFFTPYSIYYWDSLSQSGMLDRQLQAEKSAIEMLLKYENVKLFSFFDNFEMITNLDNYKDMNHYGEWVNSWMLEWTKDGKYQLTKKNYLDYCARVKKFYSTYDYDKLFQD